MTNHHLAVLKSLKTDHLAVTIKNDNYNIPYIIQIIEFVNVNGLYIRCERLKMNFIHQLTKFKFHIVCVSTKILNLQCFIQIIELTSRKIIIECETIVSELFNIHSCKCYLKCSYLEIKLQRFIEKYPTKRKTEKNLLLIFHFHYPVIQKIHFECPQNLHIKIFRKIKVNSLILYGISITYLLNILYYTNVKMKLTLFLDDIIGYEKLVILNQKLICIKIYVKNLILLNPENVLRIFAHFHGLRSLCIRMYFKNCSNLKRLYHMINIYDHSCNMNLIHLDIDSNITHLLLTSSKLSRSLKIIQINSVESQYFLFLFQLYFFTKICQLEMKRINNLSEWLSIVNNQNIISLKIQDPINFSLNNDKANKNLKKLTITIIISHLLGTFLNFINLSTFMITLISTHTNEVLAEKNVFIGTFLQNNFNFQLKKTIKKLSIIDKVNFNLFLLTKSKFETLKSFY